MKMGSNFVKTKLFIALVGSVLTLVQLVLLTVDSDGICFNEGCEIIDSLTTVSPIIFNAFGFVFFQLVMWCLWYSKKGGKGWLIFVNLLLLGGMASEGVLVGFQYFVAETFCSYCLVIFTLIIILTVFAGLRQILVGGIAFLSVLLAFSSLQFSSARLQDKLSLEKGSFAYVKKNDSDRQVYLFFSSSCPHCETVMESLYKTNLCNIRFNPITPIESVTIGDAIKTDDYSPEINRRFLKGLGINEIPVLAIQDEGSLQVLKGESRIVDYLKNNCQKKEAEALEGSGGFTAAPGFDFLPPSQGDDSCSVSEDCEETSLPALNR